MRVSVVDKKSIQLSKRKACVLRLLFCFYSLGAPAIDCSKPLYGIGGQGSGEPPTPPYRQLSGMPGPLGLNSSAVSNNGRYLALYSNHKSTVSIIDLNSMTPAHQEILIPKRRWDSAGANDERTLTFSPNGERLLLTNGPYVTLLGVDSGAILVNGELGAQRNNPYVVPISARWLAYDQVLVQERDGIITPFSPTGVLSDLNQTVFDQPRFTLEDSFTHSVNGVTALSLDATRTAFHFRNGNIGIYDIALPSSGTLFPIYRGRGTLFPRNRGRGNLIASVGSTPFARELRAPRQVMPQETSCNCQKFSPNGTYFALHAADTQGRGNILVWDLLEQNTSYVHIFPYQQRPNSIGFSHDERYLAAASPYGSIHVEDLQRKQPFLHLMTKEKITNLQFIPNSHNLLLMTYGASDQYGTPQSGSFPPPGVYLFNLDQLEHLRGTNLTVPYLSRLESP